MSIKFEKIRPGMTLHQWGRGRDLLRSMGSWPVEIIEVDAVTRTAVVSWNGNPKGRWTERALTSLRRESYYEAQERKGDKR